MATSGDERPRATRHAAATESSLATQAALDALDRGASAADAAIVAALVTGVAVPVSSGIGGGGFAVVWDAKTKAATALDFREIAPAGLDVEAFERPNAPRGMVVGVPGEVAGLAELHRRWGKLPFAADVEPAAKMAEDGFGLPPHMARALLTPAGKAVAALPVLGPQLTPGGQPRRAGDLVRAPALAATLRTIAKQGAAGFYEGPVASSIVAAARREGGALTEDDLRAYRVVERAPLRGVVGDLEVLTMPPPSAGGLMLLETLGVFAPAELATLSPTTPDGAHLLAESMRASFADRIRSVGDPDRSKVDVGPLLDARRLAARRAAIRPDRTRAPAAFVTEDHGTTHLVVIDAEENVVSLTTTVNNAFGARLVAEASGVLLNDELADFVPRAMASKMGVTDPPGAARPGARPPSSMCPTVVLRGGRPLLALGGSGGLRIATGVSQVAAGVLAQGLTVDEAVRRPRIHVAPDGALVVERGAFGADALRDLQTRGEVVREDENVSAVQAIFLRRDARSEGVV